MQMALLRIIDSRALRLQKVSVHTVELATYL